MARKTLGTRQKLVFRLPPGRPGNPFVVTAVPRPPASQRKPSAPKIARIPLADPQGAEEEAQ